MRDMSKEEQDLIDELYGKNSFLNIFKRSDTRKIEILQSLANSRSMLTLTFLLPFAIETSETVRSTARDTIHKIICRHGKQNLIGFDQYMRRLAPYHYQEKMARWHHLSPEYVKAIRINDESDVSFIGICSFHRNGYVREAAVEMLAHQFSGKEIPFLLLRMNDWLPKIRFMAFKALKQRIRPDYVKHFLEAICLVKHLSEYYNREKFSDFVDEIYGLFRHPENRKVLLSGFHSKDPIVRRFCFELAINLPDIEQESVISEALRQSDAWIRLQVAKHICRNYSNECLIQWLKRIRSDVFPPIRQLALQTYMERFSEESTEELLAALLDRHKTIREMARYYLKDKRIDFSSFYREKLNGTNERLIQAAIAGVGETGDKTDAQWIIPFLCHENARTRRAAVKALGMLNPEDYTDVFINSLQSDKPSVSREARQVLANIIDLRHAELLWGIYVNDLRPYVKKNILFLFTKFGKADNILYLLRACAVQEEEIRDLAKRHVESWMCGYNTRFYVSMSDEKRQKLKGILDEVKDFLPEYTVREFEFLISKN